VIGDSETRFGLPPDAVLGPQNDLFSRRLHGQQSAIIKNNRVDQRQFEFQPRFGHDADRRSEPDNQGLLHLTDRVERSGEQPQQKKGTDTNDKA